MTAIVTDVVDSAHGQMGKDEPYRAGTAVPCVRASTKREARATGASARVG